MCHGQYHTLDQHIGFAFAKEPAEGQIGLDVGKGALRLDGPVETQQDTGFALNALQVILTLPDEFLGYREMLIPFIFRLFPVVAMNALLLERAAFAFFAGVYGFLGNIARFGLAVIGADQFKLFMVGTFVGILFGLVGHVLEPADVFAPFACLAFLVVVGLDEGILLVLLQISVVFLAFIAGICYDIPVSCMQVVFHILQKGLERGHVRWLRPYRGPSHELRVDTILDVVGWFQLPVAHGIFLHAHEGGVRIRLGKTVARTTDV